MSQKTIFSFVFGFITSVLITLITCVSPIGKTKNKQVDSLHNVINKLELEKMALKDSIKISSEAVKHFKELTPKAKVNYSKSKEEAVKQLTLNPCDSLNNLNALNNVITACDTLNNIKDSTLSYLDIKVAQQEEYIAKTDTMLMTYKAIDNIQATENKALKKQLRRQKIKTLIVAITGAVAVALITYFSFIK